MQSVRILFNYYLHFLHEPIGAFHLGHWYNSAKNKKPQSSRRQNVPGGLQTALPPLNRAEQPHFQTSSSACGTNCPWPELAGCRVMQIMAQLHGDGGHLAGHLAGRREAANLRLHPSHCAAP